MLGDQVPKEKGSYMEGEQGMAGGGLITNSSDSSAVVSN